MKEKDESPSAIDALVSGLKSNSDTLLEEYSTDFDAVAELDSDVEEISKEPGDNSEDGANVDDVKADLTDEDIDEEGNLINKNTEDDKDKKSNKNKETNDDIENNKNDEDVDEHESNQIELFFDAFSESLGWELDESEEKPNSIEGLIKYMQDLIEEESEPDYSSDKVKELDEYIKNGGKFETFYSLQVNVDDLDDIDITDENIQKKIAREYLKEIGNTDAQIERKIQRWEDAGVLEDEANDSLELLKSIRENKKNAELEQVKTAAKQKEEATTKFYNDVVTQIDKVKDIRGIKIPEEDRKILKDYAFKIEADGTTKYQKDYSKNLVKNFIESAYFTMKGDTLINAAKKNGETSATEKLRNSLKHKGVGKSKQSMDNNPKPIWQTASKVLRG